jgi:SAM-dependent methyltransferase
MKRTVKERTVTRPGKPQPSPDREAALARYRQRAAFYDVELAAFEWIRRRAISRLGLRPGEVVLDAGCGTGLSLGLLHQGVGAKGAIVGIDQSPEMIERARERVASHRWRNVTLLTAPVESARIPVRADAALFHFTHDVLRRPEAVANVVRHLLPGARIVACGLKWAPAWALPANLAVWAAAQYSVSSLEGLDRPWDRLAAHTGPLEVESLALGGVYLASGRLIRAA